MQTVFGVSAVTLLVPVTYHLQRTSEASSLDPNAPGMQHARVSAFGSMLQSALLRLVSLNVCTRALLPSE